MIDICIPVKNEIRNLEVLAKNIPANYSVYVVNSGYDSDTEKLCRSVNWNFIEFNWDGCFPKKRNWFLENYFGLLSEWVLFLDADEHITSAQLELLERTIQNHAGNYEAYILKYSIYFLGKKLKFTPPMSKISLIKKELRYEKIDEDNWSKLDMEIHEHPVVAKKKLGKLNILKIDHREERLIKHYIGKHNEYSDWEAHRMIQVNEYSFRSFKYKLISKIWMPRLYFLYIYFWKLSFLDGREGYLFAKFKEFYFLSIIAKRIEQDI